MISLRAGRHATQVWTPAWRRLGLPGAFGVVALSLCLLLDLGLTPMWRDQAHAAEKRAFAERVARADRQHLTQTPERDRAAEPGWPARSERDARLARLLHLAHEHRVTVLGVQQQPDLTDVARPVAWNRVTLPVRADYGDLRAFLAEALRADAALALDGVRLQRVEGGRVPVDAELAWSFAQAGGQVQHR
jgi:hypothetical protein